MTMKLRTIEMIRLAVTRRALRGRPKSVKPRDRRKNRIWPLFTFAILAVVVGGVYWLSSSRLVPVASAQAQVPLWQESPPVSVNTATVDQQSGHAPESSQHAPKRYKAFELNESALANLLAEAPLEFTEAAEGLRNEITLPTPDGGLARFRFVESPIMEPKLAAQFPDIKTYRGWGIDDPSATTRFSRTSKGFHAIVLSSKDGFYIDPVSSDDTLTYASYYTGDAGGDGVGECLAGLSDKETAQPDRGALKSAPRHNLLATQSANNTGILLRDFRLAVAATGEYTRDHGGTPDTAMVDIATTINDVNAIYQRELAVCFTLVGDNKSIIFTGELSDPYISPNVDGFLDENQEVLDDIIGEGNYDIGHVFDTRFSFGKATGLTCDDGEKGKGMSSPADSCGPGGDFSMTVAHEIGHQFGAHHTFNGDCGDPSNRHDDTAYEPGCGHTIMSYGGYRESYFHGTSLRLMTDYINNNCGGCGRSYNNINMPPQVTVPPASGPLNPFTFFIPAQTPFTLRASGSDPDQNPLSYSWEEIDYGSPGPWDADRGDNPLFVSQSPIADPSATFPTLEELRRPPNWAPPLMASTSRMLRFLVTARDKHGGFDQGAVILGVVGAAGPFVVTAPALGTPAIGGSSMTVTWDVANTHTGLINAPLVRISLSTDNGETFPIELAASTQNDGSFTFTVPCVTAQQARIKVEAIDNIFFSFSPAFTISGVPNISTTGYVRITTGGPPVSVAVATVTDPHGSPGLLTVQPTTSLPSGVTISFANRAGIVWAEMATAECSSPVGSHEIRLQVGTSTGCTDSTTISLIVDPNPAPTVGTYSDASVIAGQSVTVSPMAPPADPNGNLDTITARATTPLAATFSYALIFGQISIHTAASAQPGLYIIEVTVTDRCNATVTRTFLLTVVNSPPQITRNANSARTTRGGIPGAWVDVATISDQQDPSGTLGVSATATGMTVEVRNTTGTVSARATAPCAVADATYTATVNVTDSASATASATFPVIVEPNTPPTLGTYFDSGVTVGGSVINVPTVAPSDPNNPAIAPTFSVNPQFLPGGGQVIPHANGRVTINTVFSTTVNTYPISVTARDACGAETTKSFRLTVRDASCPTEQSMVFAADTAKHRIQRFNGTNWNVIGSGTPGSGLGQFTSPESVVASANGQRIYVADTGNLRIQWSQNGGVTWAIFASGLIPQGLVLDRDGNLYVSDSRDNRVVRYAGGVPGSPIVLAAPGSGAGQVSNPNGLAIDCRMNLYVADTGNNRILTIVTADSTMIPNTGTVMVGSGAGLNPAQVTAPQGVAVNNAGRLYVADTGNNRVISIASAPSPGAATVVCSTGAALGQVNGPEGVTIAAFAAGPLAGVSSISVSDTINNRIQARALPAGAWILIGSPVQFQRPSKIR